MSKRATDDQLTKDNYEQDVNEDASETFGSFQKASNDEISRRVIKAPRSRLAKMGGDAPKAPSPFASFGAGASTPPVFGSTTPSGFVAPTFGSFGAGPAAATTTSTTPSSTGFGLSSTPFSGFGEKTAGAASSTSTFTGFGAKTDESSSSSTSTSTGSFSGFSVKPSLSESSFGEKKPDSAVAPSILDKAVVAPSFKDFGGKASAPTFVFGDKPSAASSSAFGAKTDASSSSVFGAKPAASSASATFGDKAFPSVFSGSSFNFVAPKGADSGSTTDKEKSTLFASPGTQSSLSTIKPTTTISSGSNSNAFNPTLALKDSTSSSSLSVAGTNKTTLKRELSDLNRMFIQKIEGAFKKQEYVNLAQVFNKYIEGRVKIKRSHNGSEGKTNGSSSAAAPKQSLFSSTPKASSALFSTKASEATPLALFTGRKLSTDDNQLLDQYQDGNGEQEEDEQSYQEDQSFPDDGQSYQEGEEEDDYQEDSYAEDEEAEDEGVSGGITEEEPKSENPPATGSMFGSSGFASTTSKPATGGFNFSMDSATKPKPTAAAINFGLDASTTTGKPSASTTSAPATGGFGSFGGFGSTSFGSGSSGGFGTTSGGFGTSTATTSSGGFGNTGFGVAKDSSSTPKTLSTSTWNFGTPSTSSTSTSATPSAPFTFAPPKPFAFTAPGSAATAGASTTAAPFSGFQVPVSKDSAAVTGDSSKAAAEDDKMPDDTQSQLQDNREGEEDERTVYEVRAKLYGIVNNESIDLGVGPFRVNENNQTKKRRMIMRTMGTGSILLNSWVIPSLPPKREKTHITVFTIEDGKPKRFILRVKEESSAIELVKELELGLSNE
ncbi:hypothetical protein BG004_007451 [Podila humilis]|nr:hypothetical protein BG004_007451 [Podila humilis]